MSSAPHYEKNAPRRCSACCAVILLSLLFHCGRGIYISDNAASAALIRETIQQYRNPNWETRQKVVSDLVKQSEGSENKLLEIAIIVSSEDPHPGVRIEAIKGLSSIKTDRTVARLNTMALTDDSPNVRWQALKALASFRAPGSIETFAQSYTSDDWLIREASIEGMMKLGELAPRERIVAYAEKGMKDPSESVQIAAMRHLTVKDETLFPIIREIFNKEKKSNHPLLQASLIALKGYTLDAQTREDVISLLAHRNLQIRLQALRVLKEETLIKARIRK
jgi:HEAT repeat protein